VGDWPQGRLTTASAGPVRLAVIGQSPVGPARLAELAGRLGRPSDIDHVLAELRGSCFVAVSTAAGSRLQGSSSGLCRVFHVRLGPVVVAADRADLLASLSGAPLNEEALALRAACGLRLPYPANAQTMWTGVSALAPDHCLQWDEGGERVRETRCWKAPEADLAFPEGAAAVRDAIDAAVSGVHPGEAGRLSTDLSGGLDSSSLCFLAARERPDLLTFRWGEAEHGNDDALFAEIAMNQLRRAEHLVVPQSGLPEIFADPGAWVSRELPSPLTRATARIRYSAGLLAQRGSVRHLAGHGGDELFSPLPGYLSDLLRRRPLTALRHVRAQCALHHWPLRST
jgi:asparagine synthase (glutamine-hydrolysing)